MTYLVDANVLSEPTEPAPDTRVVSWLSDHEGDLAVDSIILGELYLGVLVLPDGRKRSRLQTWFDELMEHELTLVTRNVHDFRLAGVQVLDPFA